MKEFFQVRGSPHQRPSRNTWVTEEAHTTKEMHGAFSRLRQRAEGASQ